MFLSGGRVNFVLVVLLISFVVYHFAVVNYKPTTTHQRTPATKEDGSPPGDELLVPQASRVSTPADSMPSAVITSLNHTIVELQNVNQQQQLEVEALQRKIQGLQGLQVANQHLQLTAETLQRKIQGLESLQIANQELRLMVEALQTKIRGLESVRALNGTGSSNLRLSRCESSSSSVSSPLSSPSPSKDNAHQQQTLTQPDGSCQQPEARFCPRYVHNDTRPLHLIYLADPVPIQYGGGMTEGLWIRDTLLGRLSRPVVTHIVPPQDRYNFFRSDSLVVCLAVNIERYVKLARSHGVVNLGVYWMGNEVMTYPKVAAGGGGGGKAKGKKKVGTMSSTVSAPHRKFLQLVDYVFRTYYFQEYDQLFTHVHWFPLGTKSGVGCGSQIPLTLPLASQRKYLCSFIGSLRGMRGGLITFLRSRGVNCTVQLASGWEAQQQLHVISYRLQYLEHSMFTLCPWGNNVETVRHYEALEHGSIPITFRYKHSQFDFLNALGPNLPFPVFSGWNDVPAFLQHYQAHPALANQLQRKVLEWWLRKKDELMRKVTSVVEQGFAKYAEGTPEKRRGDT